MKTDTNNQAIIVSDAHLPLDDRPGAEQQRRRFLRLLEELREQTGLLVLLGDIFDFWYEWRHVVPKRAFPLLNLLASMVRAGTPVHYFAGNHDFRLAGFLAETVGLELHLDEWVTTLDGKRCYFHHGDGMAASDANYRRMKRIFRHPFAQGLFGTLVHPDLALEIGRRTSDGGRHRREQGQRREPPYTEYRARAESLLRQGNDLVVFGHTHDARYEALEGGHYLNPGAFVDDSRYAIIAGGEPRLETFSA